MPSPDQFAYMDALDLASLVRQKQVQPIELVDAVISRIERLNPTLNAVVTPMYDEARRRAQEPLPEGPLSGVPFLLKDFLAEYAGVRMTEGSRFLSDFVPDEDSELVKRIKRAGLITVAKTNTPALACGPTTEPQLFGAAHNPWDTNRTTGGSSGGAGASVASGIVSIAHGNDAGGSIRIPASCCGVFGLKPTRGRNPLGPLYGDIFSGFVSEHVLTRSVRESAAFLDASSGPDLGDPYATPPPDRPFLEEVGASPGRLRIAYSGQTTLGTPLDPDCAAALQDAVTLCAELGHEVVEASPDFDGEEVWQGFVKVCAAGFAWVVDDWARRTGRTPTEADFEPFVWAYTMRGREISAPEYLMITQDLQKMTRSVARFHQQYDLWLTPTLGQPPVDLGHFAFNSGDDPIEMRRRMAEFSPFTFITNGTGQPSASIPLYWNGQGLPIGVHLAARYGDEATIFRLASQLEEARPWKDRRPPVAV